VEEIEHWDMEGRVNTGVALAHCDTVVGVVVGSSSRHMAACSYYTSAEDIADADGDADADCMVSSFLHLAACLALPADDGHSSCRLGRVSLPNRPRLAFGLEMRVLL
jgi:hypothetical protein